MAELPSHLFVAVGREVDDEQTPGRGQSVSGLGNRSRRILEKVQDVMEDRDVDRPGFDVEVVDVAAANGAMGEVVESAPGDVQHLGAQIDPDAEVDAVGQELEHSAGARADVKEGADVIVTDLSQKCCLDRLVTDVQRPHRIPVSGDALEVGSCSRVAVRANRGQPIEVASHGRGRLLALDHEVEYRVEQLSTDSVACRPIEHTGALRLAIEQAGLGQHLQVAADPGLALPQHATQLAHRQLALRQHVKGPQPCRFSDRSQRAEEMFHFVII